MTARGREPGEARRPEIEAMNRRIAQALAEMGRGEGIEGEEARRRSLSRLAERLRRRGQR